MKNILIIIAALIWVNHVAAQEPRKPNVVFVLIDDMGYADLGCMGSKDAKTPNIDRLAKEGVRFTQFYSNAPVCTPTRAAFITGRYQQRSGLEWALGFTAEQKRRENGKWVVEHDMYAAGLTPRGNSITQLLHLLGYRCGIFGKWHLGFQPRFNPIRHGFHEYFGVLTGHADYYSYKYFDGTYVLREGDKEAKAKGYLTDLLTQRAVDFINNNAERPFFLYVPHLALHFPFQTPDNPTQILTKENHNKGTRKGYVAMLERVDQGVGQMLTALEKTGNLDNTLFILSSDNGGYYLSDNGPLFHHKTTLWEGGVRVPCLMRWPDRLPKGNTTTQVGITMDLTATILNAAGYKSPVAPGGRGVGGEGASFDGIDLLPILTGKQKETPRTLFWRIDRTNRKQQSVRDGDWKYLKDGDIELLFDLSRDPGQRDNLNYRHPEIVERLRRAYGTWEKEMDQSEREFLVK